MMTWDNVIDFQGAQGEREGLDGHGTLKLRVEGVHPLGSFASPPIFLAFCLALRSLEIYRVIPGHQSIPSWNRSIGVCPRLTDVVVR